jgi:hypothetical protein
MHANRKRARPYEKHGFVVDTTTVGGGDRCWRSASTKMAELSILAETRAAAGPKMMDRPTKTIHDSIPNNDGKSIAKSALRTIQTIQHQFYNDRRHILSHEIK